MTKTVKKPKYLKQSLTEHLPWNCLFIFFFVINPKVPSRKKFKFLSYFSFFRSHIKYGFNVVAFDNLQNI